jgi:beta-glucosidase
VGYTRDDEGEYFGSEGTAHLTELFPGPDDPDLAARFTAHIAAGPGLAAHPPGVEGERAEFTTGGDRRSLRLHARDEALIEAIAAANARTIVVIVAGSAVIVSPWANSVPAIVQSWYGGMESGHGLCDVLFGTADATGRLPFSVPFDERHLPPFDPDARQVVYDSWHGWWLLEATGTTPQFPFGFGLSYTTFAYDEFSAEVEGEDLVVRGIVRNTGGRTGTDVVQVYGRLASSDAHRRLHRRLLGFARLEMAAGAQDVAVIRIPVRRLAVRDVTRHGWRVEEGSYRLDIGRHAGDLRARHLSVDVAGETWI